MTKLPGVSSAEATVNDVDFKDKPGEWYIQLTAEAESSDGIATIPSELTTVLDKTQQSGPTIRVDLHIPGGPGLAPTTLGALSDGAIRTAITLRATPGVSSVNGTAYRPSVYVSMDPTTTLTTITPSLRNALDDGGDAVPDVIVVWNEQEATHLVSVGVSPAWPSDELAAVLKSIAQLQSLKYLSASPASQSESVATITVEVSNTTDATTSSNLLLDLLDSGDSTPTHFWIHGPEGDDLEGMIN